MGLPSGTDSPHHFEAQSSSPLASHAVAPILGTMASHGTPAEGSTGVADGPGGAAMRVWLALAGVTLLALLVRARSAVYVFANAGEVVLDPFSGSGTTAAVAKKLGRRFIGIEREPGYIKLAEERLARVPAGEPGNLAVTPSKRSEPRIPFGNVVERGLLDAGQMLYDARRRHSAKVRADGSLVCGDASGSIHQIGAHVQGAPACNGWSFWHFDVEGKLVSIDVLRRKLRAETN